MKNLRALAALLALLTALTVSAFAAEASGTEAVSVQAEGAVRTLNEVNLTVWLPDGLTRDDAAAETYGTALVFTDEGGTLTVAACALSGYETAADLAEALVKEGYTSAKADTLNGSEAVLVGEAVDETVYECIAYVRQGGVWSQVDVFGSAAQRAVMEAVTASATAIDPETTYTLVTAADGSATARIDGLGIAVPVPADGTFSANLVRLSGRLEIDYAVKGTDVSFDISASGLIGGSLTAADADALCAELSEKNTDSATYSPEVLTLNDGTRAVCCAEATDFNGGVYSFTVLYVPGKDRPWVAVTASTAPQSNEDRLAIMDYFRSVSVIAD